MSTKKSHMVIRIREKNLQFFLHFVESLILISLMSHTPVSHNIFSITVSKSRFMNFSGQQFLHSGELAPFLLFVWRIFFFFFNEGIGR